MITILGRRWPLASVRLYSAAVQGDAAAEELANALRRACADRVSDVLIIGRGGGASEDLSAFNDEQLCRAIAACQIPIISAVGHETDSGLTDLVADVRAATPSQAAEMATPDMADIVRQLSQYESRLTSCGYTNLARAARLELTAYKLSTTVTRQTQQSRERLRQLENKLVAPTEYIALKRHDVAYLAKRLSHATDQAMKSSQSTLAHLSAQLSTLSPLATLGRGYGIVLRGDTETNRSIGSVEDVAEQTPVEIRLKMASSMPPSITS